MKQCYVVQPYWVGSKTKQSKYKSMAMVIPREVVEYCHIDTSTIFVLKIGTRKNIVVDIIENIEKFHQKMIPADESFPASKQQASSEVQ